jgi:hypothetical protein
MICRDTRSGENNITVQGYGVVMVLLHSMVFDRICNNTLQDFIKSDIKVCGIIAGVCNRYNLLIDWMMSQALILNKIPGFAKPSVMFL